MFALILFDFCAFISPIQIYAVFKPPPPEGAGGGYMFSGRPSVPLSVRVNNDYVTYLCSFTTPSCVCLVFFYATLFRFDVWNLNLLIITYIH